MAQQGLLSTPEFTVVEFEDFGEDSSGFFLRGQGRFSQADQDQVEADIKMAEQWAKWLEDHTGSSVAVNFSIKNNILSVEIRVWGFLSPEQEEQVQNWFRALTIE